MGGTGLYITSLLNGIGFTPEKVDPAIRQELQARLQAEGSQALYAELAAVDPGYAAKVHPNNTPRVIRALELYRATGRKMSAEREAARQGEIAARKGKAGSKPKQADKPVQKSVPNPVKKEARAEAAAAVAAPAPEAKKEEPKA